MYRVFRTLHDMFRRVHNMYPHTIIYFVSCTLLSIYVASKMTNSKLVPKNTKISKKIQKFPKKLKFSKKAKIFQKNQKIPKKPNLGFFFGKFGFFLAFFLETLAILANFGFFGHFFFFFLAFLENFGF
jgi:hypothetical protein